MRQLWQFWESGINQNTITAIEELSSRFPDANAGLGFDGSTDNNNYRKSEIKWIDPNIAESKFLVDTLWYFAKEANRAAFGFDIDYLPDIQYTKYSSTNEGKYDWHCDTFWGNPTCYDRKISIVIQLTDSSEYEGGDFEIDPQYAQLPSDRIRQKGTVIVFPSFLAHRVTPVTKGVRKSLVSWIQGPKFR